MAEQVRPSESDRTELTPEAGLSHQRSLAQQRSRDRLERILAAASRLIAEKGSDHVKMSEVAASAEISIGSLYQYFPDKRAIIRTLAERYAAASRQCIEQALADVRDLKELRDAFASLVDQYYAIFLAEPVMRDIWSGHAGRQGVDGDRVFGKPGERRAARCRHASRSRRRRSQKTAASAFLVWQLGEATMRLAVSLPRREGDAIVEAYKRMTLREIAEV